MTLSTVENRSRRPISLTGGGTLTAGSRAVVDVGQANEAAWIEAGCLVIVQEVG